VGPGIEVPGNPRVARIAPFRPTPAAIVCTPPNQGLAMNTKTISSQADELESDVKKVLHAAEDLLSQATNSTGDKAAELRGRALEQLKALSARLRDVQETALEKGRAAADATDDYVHDHPWRSILAAASLGVVVGLLIGRR